MAFGYCDVTILGNLVKDPIKRTTDTGKEYSYFTVAVNKTKTKCIYMFCTAWEERSKIMDMAHKGDTVMIKGSINAEEKSTPDGIKYNDMSLSANKIILLGKKSVSDESYNQKPVSAKSMNVYKTTEDETPADPWDDDTTF